MKFRCYIFGKDDDWEAICTDLDIAVQGNSYEITKSLLDDAIGGFLHEVAKLPAKDQKEFLNRRAPLLVRINLRIKFYFSRVHTRSQEVSAKVQEYFFTSSPPSFVK